MSHYPPGPDGYWFKVVLAAGRPDLCFGRGGQDRPPVPTHAMRTHDEGPLPPQTCSSSSGAVDGEGVAVDTQQSRPTLIQSVQRALRLLEVVAGREGGAPAKELARAMGLPLATTYHLLRTCAHEGWLQRLEDGSYVLGHQIDVVREQGSSARRTADARPALEWLRDECSGPVYLAQYIDGEIVVADIVDSPRTPRIDLWVGIHDAAHATAIGKCVLSRLPADAREDYFARHPLHDLTARTVVDRRRLRLVEPDGVALDDGEYAVGVSCLAAPVLAPGGAGAVAVVAPPIEVVNARTRQAVISAGERVSRALMR